MSNDRDSQTKYDAKKGVLVFDTESSPLFNYDGQHRELGYCIRVENDESFAEFPVPVVMTRGMDKLPEMLQFQTINSTAKGGDGACQRNPAKLYDIERRRDQRVKASKCRLL